MENCCLMKVKSIAEYILHGQKNIIVLKFSPVTPKIYTMGHPFHILSICMRKSISPKKQGSHRLEKYLNIQDSP